MYTAFEKKKRKTNKKNNCKNYFQLVFTNSHSTYVLRPLQVVYVSIPGES